MPITASDLIKDRPYPTTVSPNDTINDALSLMHVNDFSQLPVIDQNKKQNGIITSESILKAQKHLNAVLEELRVPHAVIKAAKASPDDTLFDVFELFSKHSAVLVVDSENALMGIITPWDAATHLQQRSEDLMLIEDIESAIKEHIRASFTDRNTGKQFGLNEAITKMLDHSERRFKDIVVALKQYFGRVGLSHKLQLSLVRQAFDKLVTENRQQKTFEDLTLNEYIELLLHNEFWPAYSNTFNLDAGHLRNLLNNVRDIRNQLAHFRDETTLEQRQQLRYCKDLFDRHPVPEISQTSSDKVTVSGLETLEAEVEPTEEALGPGESRYARLALHLQQLPRKQQRIELTFDEITGILQGELPPSAWQHRSWWANDSVGHVQSKQWLEAGWRVASVSITDNKVTFARSEERQQMYIQFYSELLNKLRTADAFEFRDVSPSGGSWITIAVLPRNAKRRPASLAFAFSRGKRFRVELYVDTGSKDENERIFDLLVEEKGEIEKVVGTSLQWEKLVSKRASRIALYHDGHIEDVPEELDKLQNWAVDAVIRFQEAIIQRAERAIEQVL